MTAEDGCPPLLRRTGCTHRLVRRTLQNWKSRQNRHFLGKLLIGIIHLAYCHGCQWLITLHNEKTLHLLSLRLHPRIVEDLGLAGVTPTPTATATPVAVQYMPTIMR